LLIILCKEDVMSKALNWFKQPVRVIVLGAIMYFIATGVKAVYFAKPWYMFW